MVCRTVFQLDRYEGLSERKARLIAQEAAYFPGEIRVRFGMRYADAHAAEDLLALDIPPGAWICVESDRFDAGYVIDRIRRIATGTAHVAVSMVA